jgi:hypothetical protein
MHMAMTVAPFRTHYDAILDTRHDSKSSILSFSHAPIPLFLICVCVFVCVYAVN